MSTTDSEGRSTTCPTWLLCLECERRGEGGGGAFGWVGGTRGDIVMGVEYASLGLGAALGFAVRVASERIGIAIWRRSERGAAFREWRERVSRYLASWSGTVTREEVRGRLEEARELIRQADGCFPGKGSTCVIWWAGVGVLRQVETPSRRAVQADGGSALGIVEGIRGLASSGRRALAQRHGAY